ncbi:MAG: class I SAM-dependent methyltransferase, partial [Clostridia bacterium]|nr:class I SAM-dependent methyltransferase [Clostridia bacterium]
MIGNEKLDRMRTAAKEGRDPTAADETVVALVEWAKEHRAVRILEIGAGEGLTSCALLLETEAELTAIELLPDRAKKFRENVALFGLEDRVRLFEGDAGEILPILTGSYDLIFLDGPKVQYRRYFDDCKRLLKGGGALFSDDILLFGWVRGEAPKKRKMLAEHIREYLGLLESDPDFKTQIYEYGEG